MYLCILALTTDLIYRLGNHVNPRFPGTFVHRLLNLRKSSLPQSISLGIPGVNLQGRLRMCHRCCTIKHEMHPSHF